MEFRKIEVIPGKTRCDLCQRSLPPITECQFPYYARKKAPTGPEYRGRCQWVDLCTFCMEVLQADPQEYAAIDTFTAPQPEDWRRLQRRGEVR